MHAFEPGPVAKTADANPTRLHPAGSLLKQRACSVAALGLDGRLALFDEPMDGRLDVPRCDLSMPIKPPVISLLNG